MNENIDGMFQFQDPNGEIYNIPTSSNHVNGKAPTEYDSGCTRGFSATEVADFIVSKDESFWQDGNGNGQIEFFGSSGEGKRTCFFLFISRIDEAGFLLKFGRWPCWAVAVNETCGDDVDHHICYDLDQNHEYHSKLFVSPEVARTVILSFLADDTLDGLPTGCKWIKTGDLREDDVSADYPWAEWPVSRHRLPDDYHNALIGGESR